MTVEGHRVVATTPYGRKNTVSILFEYMKRDHEAGILDEWELWMNTDPDQIEDVAYAHLLSDENDWITLKERPAHRDQNHVKQYNTRTFFEYNTDPNTIYVRFDDDIVYVHEDAIENLVKQQIHNDAFVSFPIIINNAVSSWHLQMQGVIPRDWGKLEPYCMDPIGWADGEFAEKLHLQMLANIEAGTPEKMFMYNDVQLPANLQFSVSCFAYSGQDLIDHCDPPGYIEGMYDEHFFSVEMPQKLNRPNIIVGTSLVSHYTFFPQREHIEGTHILDKYREVSQNL